MSVRVLFTPAMTTSQCCRPYCFPNVRAVVFCLLSACAISLGAASTEKSGLASRHPGDKGIASDPAVIFSDDFESSDLKRWDESRGSIKLTSDAPNSGKQCVASEILPGRNIGGDAKKWFMPGKERVYARFYVKFSPDYQYVHHFVTLMGNHRTNRWSAFGKAGLKPNGTYFSSGMEPWFAWGKNPPPGELNFYSYFLDMEPDRKMDKYWGNSFFPPGPERGKAAHSGRFVPKLNTWQCWEFMLKANAPGKSDGEQAMWVDEQQIGHFTGIRWRDDPDVKVNCFWLQHYGGDPGDPTKQFWKERQTVWFDDVVIATEYIGPRL
jgi:hypothetical protein